MLFFLYRFGDDRDLHVLTTSFPTRRSSDLPDGRHPAGLDRCGVRRSDRRARETRYPHQNAALFTAAPIAEITRADYDRVFAVNTAGTFFRSEEHTSELQSLMRISYAVFCLKKKKKTHSNTYTRRHKH